MSKHVTRVEHATRMEAYSSFGPALIDALMQSVAKREGKKGLKELERTLVELVEVTDIVAPHADAMKEFAIELIVSSLHKAGEHPDAKQSLEEIEERRTDGRSENPNTLEQQLQSGLEDSFPASDPPSVVSTAISGGTKEIVGTDEVLRRKKKELGRERAEDSS
ncbi:hypothetical protein [Mesorhizobium sp. ORS 3428]|uniref:hypothetical protein n=1 Tax=Mesorhizobium sp. ORS 3428 TaxID=540997 RepID=UPI0008DA1CB9|nr:hypothetical protein [Mesorhizobium sp. ORS 3428]OHV87345.1 hypothetical protein ORS3428_21655 [Mesorhizobium sp. ORS 3428]